MLYEFIVKCYMSLLLPHPSLSRKQSKPLVRLQLSVQMHSIVGVFGNKSMDLDPFLSNQVKARVNQTRGLQSI